MNELTHSVESPRQLWQPDRHDPKDLRDRAAKHHRWSIILNNANEQAVATEHMARAISLYAAADELERTMS